MTSENQQTVNRITAETLISTDLECKQRLILPAEMLRPIIEKHLHARAENVKMPGFRKGKVPLNVLLREHGKNSFNQAVQTMVNDHIKAESQKISGSVVYSIDTPWDIVSLDTLQDTAVSVTMRFAPVIPEIHWPDYVLTQYNVQISDEDVNKTMEKMAHMTQKESRLIALSAENPAQKGQNLAYTMTYKTTGGEEKRMEGVLTLGSGVLPPEYESALEGIVEATSFKDTLRLPKGSALPSQFPDQDLAGKKTSFEITFHSIQEHVFHTLDEDFAISQGAASLNDLRKTVKEKIQERCADQNRMMKHQELETKLKKNLSFAIAPSLIHDSLDEQWYNLKSREGLSREEFHENNKHATESSIRYGLLINHIITTHNIEATNAEVLHALRALANRSQVSLEEVVAYYRRNQEELSPIVHSIQSMKALDHAITSCNTKEESVSLEDFETMFHKTGE